MKRWRGLVGAWVVLGALCAACNSESPLGPPGAPSPLLNPVPDIPGDNASSNAGGAGGGIIKTPPVVLNDPTAGGLHRSDAGVTREPVDASAPMDPMTPPTEDAGVEDGGAP